MLIIFPSTEPDVCGKTNQDTFSGFGVCPVSRTLPVVNNQIQLGFIGSKRQTEIQKVDASGFNFSHENNCRKISSKHILSQRLSLFTF